MDKETLKNLVDDLYWEFDRMSSSGQKTLDEIAKALLRVIFPSYLLEKFFGLQSPF